MRQQTTEKPWWFPVITDAAWCERIRSDYSEDTDGMDDDDIRDEYADGCKYADLWDHTGDAREQFEELADAYLELLDQWSRRAAPVVTDDTRLMDFLADPSQDIANVQLPRHIVERNVHSLRDAIADTIAEWKASQPDQRSN